MANLYSDNPIVEIVALKGADGTTPPIDSQLSDTSTNPVENKVIKENIDIINNGLGAIGAQLNSKQDKLISGENIRTINGNSLLGEGDIVIEGGETITVDDVLSDSSENPVQNKVITAALANKQDTLVIDSEMSDVSENPVQNKVVKDYIDSEGELLEADINSINSKIPAQASADNQLADKDFVNSSISTATATFRGTFETLAALQATDGDKNDYAFYSHKDSAGNTIYDRYKYIGLPETRVPDGYIERLTLNKTSGSQVYINTGVKISSTDNIYAEVNIQTTTYGQNYIFGAIDDSDNSIRLYKTDGNNLFMFQAQNGTAYGFFGSFTFEFINGKVYKDSVFVANVAPSNVDAELYLFGYNNKGVFVNSQVYINIGNFVVYDANDNKKLDLVPCTRTLDNVNGYYDLVSNRFLAPIDGTFGVTAISTDKWGFEYSLNNSSFTAEQWAAVNSGLVANVTATGFDANATQVLKNINGVLTWVTE